MINEEDQVAALVKIFLLSYNEIALDGSAISVKVPTYCRCREDSSSIAIIEKGNLEHFVWGHGTRHGKEGYRVLRYLKADVDALYNWDEQYQLYETLEELAQAVVSGDYTKGRRDF